MKKLSLLTGLMVMAVCFLFTSCGGDDVAVSGVTLNKATLTLEVGGTATLAATVTPDDAKDKSVTWKTSNAAIATVNNGTVTGVAAGTATITVTTNDGGKTATCNVTVNGGTGGSVTFGTTSWTAGFIKVDERTTYSLIDCWLCKETPTGTNLFEGPYPILNFVTPIGTGNNSYVEDGDYYFEYFEDGFLVDQNSLPYGDWWAYNGSVNVTKFSAGKISATGNVTMFDAAERYTEEGSGELITRNLTFTLTNADVATIAKTQKSITAKRDVRNIGTLTVKKR